MPGTVGILTYRCPGGQVGLLDLKLSGGGALALPEGD